MAIHVNTYKSGLNKDNSFTKYPEGTYYDAVNLNIITEDGNTTGILSNITGNTLCVSNSNPSAISIVGYTFIKNDLILWLYNSTGNTHSEIHKITEDKFNHSEYTLNSTNYYYDDSDYSLIYTDIDKDVKLDLHPEYRIKAVGIYESASIQKIYWTDEKRNFVRTLNTEEDVRNKAVGYFDIIPDNSIVEVNSINILSSGNLITGKYQYAYQLFTSTGNEGLIIPFNTLVPIYPRTGVREVGGIPGENCSKSISLNLSISDIANYESIRIYSLRYEDSVSIPTVNIINEYTIANTLTVVDTGTNYISSYTFEEFVSIRSLYKAVDIESKDNYLFVANLSEEILNLNYDARAYRFNSSGVAVVYNQYPDTYYEIDSSGIATDQDGNAISWEEIPEDYNAINISNNIYTTNDNYYNNLNFKYKNDGPTLGGDGPNISYYIRYDQTYLLSGNGYDSDIESQSPNTILPRIFTGGTLTENYTLTHYQTREVYRHGIVFIDNKGRNSFTYWIGDIRIPDLKEIRPWTMSGTNILARPIYIQFNVKYTQELIDNNVVGFKIVRVKRDIEDSVVVDAGLSGGLVFESDRYRFGENLLSGAGTGTNCTGNSAFSTFDDLYSDVLEYSTPEYHYNQSSFNLNAAAYIKPQIFTDFRVASYDVANNGNYGNYTINFKSYSVGAEASYDQNHVLTITDQDIFKDVANQAANSVSPSVGVYFQEFSGFNVYNYSQGAWSDGASDQAKTSCILIAYSGTVIPQTDPGTLYIYRLANKNNVQYNGNTYEARLNNSYISSSEIKYFTGSVNSTESVFSRGDCYITMCEYFRTQVSELADDSRNLEILYYPVESRINTVLDSGNVFWRKMLQGQIPSGFIEIIGAKEYLGVYQVADIYTQELNHYVYNSVYTRINPELSYFPETRELSIVSNNYPNRIAVSGKKILGEFSDSWTKFNPGAYIDVDASHGEISHIVTDNKDMMLFFQDNGFGKLDINKQALITDQTGAELSLGESGVLSRFDYISTNIGCSQNTALVSTVSGIYFYNTNDAGFYVYNEQLKNLSKTLGMQSYFNTITNVNSTNYINLGYDFKNKQVIIGVLSSKNGNTNTQFKPLVYSEMLQQFRYFISTRSKWFMHNDKYLLGTNNTGSLLIYRFNSGLYNQFERTIYPSTLTLIVNPNSSNMNRFDFISWITQIIDDSTINGNETISRIRFSNSYQQSEWIESNTFKKRFREWRCNFLRDAVARSPRLKDTYLKIEIEFDVSTTTNRKITLDHLKTYYEPMINY